MLLLHVSVLYERHLQEAQNILTKLCVCYVAYAQSAYEKMLMTPSGIDPATFWFVTACQVGKQKSYPKKKDHDPG
jgi:hypothetical protein